MGKDAAAAPCPLPRPVATLHARVENAGDTNLSQTCGPTASTRWWWDAGERGGCGLWGKLKMKSTLADKNRLRCKLVNTFLMRHNKWQALSPGGGQRAAGSGLWQVMSKLLTETETETE